MSGLKFEICGGRGPFARVLAVLADSWMDGTGVKAFALEAVDFGDGIDESYADSESLVLGEADGSMFSEGFFEFRVR